MGMTKTPIAKRFWRKVFKKASHECWPWLGALDKNKQYGVFVDDRRKCVNAHRAAYQLTHNKMLTPLDFIMHVGAYAEGLTTCCNPQHLRLGNSKSCAVLREKKRCMRIRAGEEVRGSKLTLDDVLDIRATTVPQTRLAAKYRVSTQHINNIVRGKCWGT